MFHVKGFAVIVNDAVSIVYHFVNLGNEVFVVFGAEMYFLFAQPFRGPTQNPGRFNYLLWWDVRLE